MAMPVSEDGFGSVDISSSQFGDDLDPSEFMELMKDPGIKLDVIRDLGKKADQGLAVDTDRDAARILIRENLEVFQSTMQFAESFGIYLLSKVDPQRSYADCLVEVTPDVLKRELFDNLRTSELEDVSVVERGKTLGESVEWIFGYDLLDEMALKAPPVPTEEPFHHYKQPSLEAIQYWLADIARFYVLFEDIYNAVKHGGRVLPKPYTELVIGSESDSHEVEMEGYASFLCRRSGSDKRYLAILPVHWLRDYSLRIANIIGRLFIHARDCAETRKEGSETFSLSFYSLEPSTENDSESWVWVQNPDHVMVLPRDEALAELTPKEPAQGRMAVRAASSDGGLRLETIGERDPSDEFPLVMGLEERPSENLYPEMRLRLDIRVAWAHTDVCQLVQLVEGVEAFKAGGDIRIEDLSEGRSMSLGGLDPSTLSLPSLPFGLERLEILCRLQRVSGNRIPFPSFPSSQQIEYIDELVERGTSSLNREQMRESLEHLRDMSQGSFTNVRIRVVEANGTEIRAELVGQVPGSLGLENPEFEDEDVQENFENAWREPGTRMRTVIHPEDDDIQATLQGIRKDPMNGLELIEETEFGSAGERLDLGIGVEYTWKGDNFWGQESVLDFIVIPPQTQGRSDA